MADTVKRTRDLKLEFLFADKDTRTQTYPNPRSDLTREDIQTFANAAKDVVIGDKAGAELVEISKVSIVEKNITTLDLTAS